MVVLRLHEYLHSFNILVYQGVYGHFGGELSTASLHVFDGDDQMVSHDFVLLAENPCSLHQILDLLISLQVSAHHLILAKRSFVHFFQMRDPPQQHLHIQLLVGFFLTASIFRGDYQSGSQQNKIFTPVLEVEQEVEVVLSGRLVTEA